MAVRYPRTLALHVEETLYAKVMEASFASGLTPSEVMRCWLREGRLADLLLGTPALEPGTLVREAMAILESALRTMEEGERL
jgi:hypothetical protein